VNFGYGDGPEVLHDSAWRHAPESTRDRRHEWRGQEHVMQLLVRFYEPLGHIRLDGMTWGVANPRSAPSTAGDAGGQLSTDRGGDIRFGRLEASDEDVLRRVA